MRRSYNLLVAVLAVMATACCSFAWPAGSVTSKEAPLIADALSRAREFGKKTDWKGYNGYLSATKYIEVTSGAKGYIYTRGGKLVKTVAAPHPSAGRMGNYAEVGWELLDKNMKIFSDTIGHYLMKSSGGKWRLVAAGGTDGYDQDRALTKAHVPERIMKRLKYR